MAKKDGPCCHCGATSTPLWRNGPPTKPVLCNACGSRWRTRGTLKYYTPIHSRGFGPGGLYGQYFHGHELPSRRKLKNINTVSENRHVAEGGGAISKQEPLEMVFADDGSIRSSSESRISFPESRIRLGSINGNDTQGPMQPSFWDRCVPSRKRTGQKRLGPSLVQKLARGLSDILQKQEQSGLSNSLEEVLIYPKGKDSADFFETSLGSVLIKRPLPSAEGKSEGSSFPMENKNSCSNDACVESQCSKLSSSAEVKYEEVKKAGEGRGNNGRSQERSCSLKCIFGC